MDKDIIEVLSTWKNILYPHETMKIVNHKKYGICIMTQRYGVLAMQLDSWIEYEKMLHVTGWTKQIETRTTETKSN